MRLPYRIHWPTETVALAVMGLNAAASGFFYRHFPDRVPTHWNVAGEVDGWSSAGFAAFFFPALIVGIYLMMLFLPLADPKKDRYAEFGRPYQAIRLALVGYLSAIYFVTGLIGLGYDIRINLVVIPSIGLLFVILGNFMPKFKPNWFVGIRTSWTLSSETVWNRTHRVGGKIFILTGLIMMVGAALPGQLAFGAMMTAVFGMTIGTVGYSWWAWREENSRPSPPAPTPDETEPPKGL